MNCPDLFARWLIVSFSLSKLFHPPTHVRRNVCFKAAKTARPKESDGWDDGGWIDVSAGEDWMVDSVRDDVPALGSESALLLGERLPTAPGGTDDDNETESWMPIEDDGTVPPIGSKSALFLDSTRRVSRDEDETAAWARTTDIGSGQRLGRVTRRGGTNVVNVAVVEVNADGTSEGSRREAVCSEYADKTSQTCVDVLNDVEDGRLVSEWIGRKGDKVPNVGDSEVPDASLDDRHVQKQHVAYRHG